MSARRFPGQFANSECILAGAVGGAIEMGIAGFEALLNPTNVGNIGLMKGVQRYNIFSKSA